MEHLIPKQTKNPLLNFYKAKLKKKELTNKTNNLIFGHSSNQKILKTFKKEILNDKNKIGQMKYKTSKNSPNSSLINYSNRNSKIDSRDFSKKDIIVNKINKNNYINVSKTKNKIKKDLFEEFVLKRMKKMNKKKTCTSGQISQRQKSIKNIFNNLRNDSSLNSNRLTKIKKTIYGNSNIYFNNHKINNKQINNSNCIEDENKKEKNTINKSGLNSINNSSLIPSSTSYRKIVVNNTHNKANNNAFYNNFLNKPKNNNNNFFNNEKGYIGNSNLLKHIENKYDNNYNNNNNSHNNNSKNKEDAFIKKYKNNSKSKIIDSTSSSKIKKINPVDYLYNSKQKKDLSKYTVKYIDRMKNNNELISFEINGSYAESNIQNKINNLSKNNLNKNPIIKKRLKIKENEINSEQNNQLNNIIDYNNEDTISKRYFEKTKLNKEHLKKMINQDIKSNFLNIKQISVLANNNPLLSGNYLIKSSQLSSNYINNDEPIKKNQEINSLINNEINNNSLLNISNNNNYNNINNQNININININNNTDSNNSINNNFLNNNFIDINNYNKSINNISPNISPINYINNKNEIMNNNNEIMNNVYQKKKSMIPINFSNINSKNNNSKIEYSNGKDINSDINDYNNLKNNNNYLNMQGNSNVKTKLIKNSIQMNSFISPNKQSEINNNDTDKNYTQEENNNDKKKLKNKNCINLENNVYDININDFSPIYDEKFKEENIQEKINKQNLLLHINKNNISLFDNKISIKNDINSNNNKYSNKHKINNNKDDIKNKQNAHKYSQSQSIGKKVKELNKKLVNNLNNINILKLKNNILLDKKNFVENISKSKIETNSCKEETTTNNNNIYLNINKKEKINTNLMDLLDSKENSKEYIENNHLKEKGKEKVKENEKEREKEKEKEKEREKEKETQKETEKDNSKENKKNIISKKIDIFSLNINNNIIDNNLNRNKNKNKIKELNKENNNIKNLNDDMLYVPESPEIIKKEPENIMLTTMSKDCDYYKEEMEKLSEYIKEYYNEYGKYPESRIEFYLYGRQIGHGAFGKVNLALHIASGRLVAIKTFAKKNLKNKYTRHKIKNEINILSKLRHPFINQILDSFETEKHIFIIMEYVCGDLLGFIRKRGKLSESISKLIFKQIIEGLKYIHKKKIVHRDIKLDNILIDLTNTVKICDFGVSKKILNGDIMYDHCGTPAYIAPEIFGNKGYEGFLCDVWSAGVTLYYMLSGIQPFRANSIKDLEKIVLKGKFEEIEEVSQEANDLIKEMLQVDPKKRITIDNILKHPWLNNVDLENRKKLNLFTENEKILLSKFDVDYLTSNKDELIENFSLKNLETNNNDTSYKYAGDTKSIIFAPYNSYIEDSKENINNNKSIDEEEKQIYKELKILNNICKFGFKVQQANIKYELSNNNDFDNGIIKTQKEEDIKNENEKIEKKYEEKMLNDKLSGLNTPRVRSANDSFEESEKIILKKDIIKKIEKRYWI